MAPPSARPLVVALEPLVDVVEEGQASWWGSRGRTAVQTKNKKDPRHDQRIVDERKRTAIPALTTRRPLATDSAGHCKCAVAAWV